MATVVEHSVGSLKQYVAIVHKKQPNPETLLCFRGCGKSSYQLLPAIYRHPSRKTLDDFGQLESSLLTRFTQRSPPFHDRVPDRRWEKLFFMQHYGVPTRLLDWSENPLIALYFAVMGAHPNRRGKFTNDAAVWVLDPVRWNQHALKGQSFKDGALTTDDPVLAAYEELHKHKDMPNGPLALYGAHNSQRIVAQRGVFVVFGKSPTPMEKLSVSEKYPKGALSKIKMKAANIQRLRNELLGYGVTESVVRPDLDGLAMEIRRQFGYGN